MKRPFRYAREPSGRYSADHGQLVGITSTISRDRVDGWHWCICDEVRGGMRADGFAPTLAAAKEAANAMAGRL